LPPARQDNGVKVIDLTLVNAIAETKYRGVVAACGVVQGSELPGSMLPFIRRNATLAGIDYVNEPGDVRQRAWNRLAEDLHPENSVAPYPRMTSPSPIICPSKKTGTEDGKVISLTGP
jgi:hypothetical protein